MNPFKQDAPKTILVIVTRRIGDVLLTTPLIHSLKNAWPGAQIDVLVFDGTAGILSANPDIRDLLTIAARPSLGEHLGLLGKIWRRYDLAVSVIPGDRPTIYAWAAGKFRVGIIVASAKHRWKQLLLNQWTPLDNLNTHTLLMNLKLTDLLGIERSHEVIVAWSSEDEKQARTLLPFDMAATPYALLHPYPMYAYKTWQRQGWLELAAWLNGQGMRIVLSGGNSADELAYVHELAANMPGSVINAAGKLSLGAVGFVANRAKIYVGPDTAVTHIAAATGTPTVALYGPSNPVKWGPWPHSFEVNANPFVMRGSQVVGNVALVQGNDPRDCVPCLGEGCEKHINSLSDCLQHLPATRVIAAAEALLSQ